MQGRHNPHYHTTTHHPHCLTATTSHNTPSLHLSTLQYTSLPLSINATIAFPVNGQLKWKNVCFYIAQYPVHWTALTLPYTWQTCPFWHQLGFSGKHSSHAAITRKDNSFTFPLWSIARYSCTHLYSWVNWASWRERKCPNFETVAKGIRTRALSIASLAFYYCAPQVKWMVK